MVAGIRVDEAFASASKGLCDTFRSRFAGWFEDFHPSDGVSAVSVGHTAAHWARRALNEFRGYILEAGARAAPDGSHVWVGFHDAALSRSALQLSFKLLLHPNAAEISDAAVREELSRLWAGCRQLHPDYQAQILMQAARTRDVPVLPFIKGARYWQYGWGCRSRVFSECNPVDNGGKRLTGDKTLSKEVFKAIGAPAPRHQIVAGKDQLEAAVRAVGLPCVVKPTQGSKGSGVTAGITTRQALEAAFENAARAAKGAVMVESHVAGEDHRLLITNGKLLRAVRRDVPSVIGDGRSTVAELVKALNGTRSTNFVKSSYLRPIAQDDALRRRLASQGLALTSIPSAGQRVDLRSNANVSTGGTATDVTEILHPHIRGMAELIARTMGLQIAGLDYITTDISKSYLETGAFIEVNSNPGLGMLMAAGNDPVEIGLSVLGEKPGRIPVSMAVLPDTALQDVGALLRSRAWADGAGWVCGAAAEIGGTPLLLAGSSAWAGVDHMLKNQAATSAWIACGATELMGNGLPVDRLDRILLCGVDLPEEWAALLENCASQVENHADWRAAVAGAISA